MLDDLLLLPDKEQARRLLVRLLPLVSNKYFREVNHILLQFINDEDIADEVVKRTPMELFALSCSIVETVTGVKDVAKRLDRKADAVLSRYYVIFVMCEELHPLGLLTYTQLGRMFDKRLDHASIVHARHMIAQYLETDELVRRELYNIGRLLSKRGHWRVLDALDGVQPLKSKHIEL